MRFEGSILLDVGLYKVNVFGMEEDIAAIIPDGVEFRVDFEKFCGELERRLTVLVCGFLPGQRWGLVEI